MTKPTDTYEKLKERFSYLNALGESAAVLHWDMAVMMPAGGAPGRGEQLAILKALRHDLLVAPEVEEWLDTAETGSFPDIWQAANLKRMRHIWTHAITVPVDLVKALSRACSSCEIVWRDARAQADFAQVAPLMEEVLKLSIETGQCKAQALKLSTYDALLNQYEPDITSAEIDAIFADLESFLPGFLDQVIEKQAKIALPPLQGPFPIAQQKTLVTEIMKALGFDFEHGRLDESAHPFCGGVPDDVRLTTRYHEDDFLKALAGTIHETGHALYEQGLPKAWRGQPIGEALGMAGHESQSLLMEMQLFRSRDFLAFAGPLFGKAFGTPQDAAWQPEALFQRLIRTERSFIRIDADEISYPLHVIMRYRLERAMIEGQLSIRELPGAWSDESRRLLGITPPDDGLGCLQDIHWYDGAWGYFPTYTLGALMAAQLFTAAGTQIPQLSEAVRQGNFRPLLDWLRANVHGFGSRDSLQDLLVRISGKPLDTQAYKAHLKRRYL